MIKMSAPKDPVKYKEWKFSNGIYSREGHYRIKQDTAGPKNGFYGKHHSDKVRKSISATKQGIGLSEWKEYISYKPYTPDFNEDFKELIRKRDVYCCVVCNRMQEELGYNLHIHHIDYDKINSFPQNCVSLCRKHHGDTQINREQWKLFFQSLLKERYNYEYTQDQKIILNFTRSETAQTNSPKYPP